MIETQKRRASFDLNKNYYSDFIFNYSSADKFSFQAITIHVQLNYECSLNFFILIGGKDHSVYLIKLIRMILRNTQKQEKRKIK